MIQSRLLSLSRTTHLLPALATCLGTLAVAAPSHAHGPEEDPYRAPSIFSYAFRGLGIGAAVGVSGVYAIGGGSDLEWQTYAMGAGIGALIGAATGLGVGLLDVSDGQLGMGAIVMRDAWYGTLLGATAGVIAGSISWMGGEDSEHVLTGAAWGAVIGAPVGVLIGIIEGNAFENRLQERRRERRGVNIRVSLQPVEGRDRQAAGWIPTLSGTF